MKSFRKHAGWYLTGYPVGGRLRKPANVVATLADLDAADRRARPGGRDQRERAPGAPAATPTARDGSCSPTAGSTRSTTPPHPRAPSSSCPAADRAVRDVAPSGAWRDDGLRHRTEVQPCRSRPSSIRRATTCDRSSPTRPCPWRCTGWPRPGSAASSCCGATVASTACCPSVTSYEGSPTTVTGSSACARTTSPRRHPATCRLDDDITSVMVRMTQSRQRHLPVLDAEGHLAGLVSIGDIVKHRLDDLELRTNVLRDAYLAHR